MTRYMRYSVEIKGKSKLITRYARKIKKPKSQAIQRCNACNGLRARELYKKSHGW